MADMGPTAGLRRDRQWRGRRWQSGGRQLRVQRAELLWRVQLVPRQLTLPAWTLAGTLLP